MTQPLEPNVVVVRGGTTGWAQSVSMGRHQLTVDEPLTSGGTDTGPDPYSLILAALGT
jgi:putative redox protein